MAVSRSQQHVQLGIVDVHPVGDQHVAAERAQAVEVDERPVAGAREVRDGVGVRRRDVERDARAALAGQLARRDDQIVGHQVVADQRHPAANARVPGRQLDHGSLAIEHVAHRPGPGQARRVRSPGAERAADADPVVGGEDPLGMTDGARLDGERDAVADRIDERARGRQLVVVRPVGLVQRHRPREDRLTGLDRIRDRRPRQPVAGEVLVGVDQARDHDRPRTADPLARRPTGVHRGVRADVDDPAVTDRHGPVADHRAGRVHRDDPVAGDEQVDGFRRRHGRYGRTNRPKRPQRPRRARRPDCANPHEEETIRRVRRGPGPARVLVRGRRER